MVMLHVVDWKKLFRHDQISQIKADYVAMEGKRSTLHTVMLPRKKRKFSGHLSCTKMVDEIFSPFFYRNPTVFGSHKTSWGKNINSSKPVN